MFFRSLVICAFVFSYCGTAIAAFTPNPFYNSRGQKCPNVSELDGTPSVTCPDIVVSNNTLVVNTSGAIVLDNSGATTTGWTKSGASIYTTVIGNYVGIGTPIPSDFLHVYSSKAGKGTGEVARIVAQNSSVTGGYAEFQMKTDMTDMRFGASGQNTTPYGGLANSGYFGTVSDHDLLLGTNNLLRVIFKNNGIVGIGTTAPVETLSIYKPTGSNSSLSLGDGDVAHGVTTLAGTNVWLLTNEHTSEKGGAQLTGFTDSTDNPAFEIKGILVSDPDENIPAIIFDGYSANGTGVKAVAATKTVLQMQNNGSALFSLLGSGNVGIASTAPTQKLDVNGTINATTFTKATVEVPSISSTSTLTNKRITPRVVTASDDSTAVIDVDVTDQYQLTGISSDTTFSTTGTATNGQRLIIRLKDVAGSKNLIWNPIFRGIGVTLPSSTVSGDTAYIGAIYNSTISSWDVVAVGLE